MKKFLVLLVAVIILFLGCSNPISSSDPANPTESKNASQILSSLGVKTVPSSKTTMVSNLTTKVDNTETPVKTIVDTSEWQPLKKKVTIFNPSAEVFQAGILNGNDYNTLVQDAKNSTPYQTTTPFSGDQAWAKDSAKTSISADLDGNGIDEIVVFYVLPADKGTAKMRVYAAGSVSDSISITGINLSQESSSYFVAPKGDIGKAWYPYLSSAKGDIDGDGKEEVFLVGYNTVYILSIDANGKTCKVTGQKTFPMPVSSVAAGDCDGDGKAEFAVCCSASSGTYKDSFALYDSSFTTYLTNPEFTSLDGLFTEACFGDFDGDHIDELCIATTYNTIIATLYNIDTGSLTVKNTITVNNNQLGNHNAGSDDFFRICPRAVDFDQNGKDDLHLEGFIYENPMTSSVMTWDAFLTNAHNSDSTISNVEVGDLDVDGKEDLIFTTFTNSSVCLQAIGLNSSSNVEAKTASFVSGQASNPWTTVSIAVGNLDNDSTRVQYTKHELTYTDPIILAVLVSPPFYATIAAKDSAYDSGYSNWTTYFGQSSTNENSSATSVGFSIGASMEYEQDVSVFGIKIGSEKISFAVSNNSTWEWNTATSITKSIQYNCVGGEDKVVFTSVPIDVYHYQILYSADPTHVVGSDLNIHIPRDFSTYMTTREFFNANNGDLADIDSTILSHTIGYPSTYPTNDEKEALLKKYKGYKSDLQSTVEGADNKPSGTKDLNISFSSTESDSFTSDFAVETSAGAGVFGLTASITAGFNTGFSYTSTVVKGTSWGGTVGYLPRTFYNDTSYYYSSGLFVYPYVDTRSCRTYWIVDYWVE